MGIAMTGKQKRHTAAVIMKILVSAALIASGIAAAFFFAATKPEMEPKERKFRASAVEVVSAEKHNIAPAVKGSGTVGAARMISFQSRVSGRVVSVSENFVPGGLVKKGETLVRLDDSDYKIALKKARGSLQQAKSDLEIELGKQETAKEDLASFRESSETEVANTRLALRKPQLLQARAEVTNARAELEQARLDLERTTINAPFNALITERNVNIGSEVGAQGELATLVCTDAYWIEARIPLDRLQYLNLDQKEKPGAAVYSQARNAVWEGRAVRTTGTLGEQSSMTTVIVEVDDPLGLKRGKKPPALTFNEYVQVEIRGKKLENVIPIPRRALREQNKVWVASDGKLDIREVDLAWKSQDRVLVQNGLEAGEKVIVSDLATPVQGMQISISDKNSAPLASQPERE